MQTAALEYRQYFRLLAMSGFFVWTVIVTNGAAAQESVRLLATHFPPYDIEGAEDGNRGFDVDVVEAAFKAVSVDVNIGFSPWSRILRLVEVGRVAGMISCADTPARRKVSLISDAISHASTVFMVRDDYDGKALSTFADIKTLRVLAVRGYSYVNDLKEAGVEPFLVDSNDSIFRMLTKGRGDVVVVGKENALYLTKILKLDQKFRFYDIADLERGSFHVCFSKAFTGSDRLNQKFSEGLKIIKKSGAYDRIHDKYR